MRQVDCVEESTAQGLCTLQGQFCIHIYGNLHGNCWNEVIKNAISCLRWFAVKE